MTSSLLIGVLVIGIVHADELFLRQGEDAKEAGPAQHFDGVLVFEVPNKMDRSVPKNAPICTDCWITLPSTSAVHEAPLSKVIGSLKLET